MNRSSLKWWIPLVFFLLIGVAFLISKKNSSKALKQEHFSIQIDGGNYFCANRSKNNLITADKTVAYDWEAFTFFFIDSNHVKIRTFFKKFICVNEGGALQANTNIYQASIFQIKKLDENRITLSVSNKDIYVNPQGVLKVSSKLKSRIKLLLKHETSALAIAEAAKEKKYKIHRFNYQLIFISIIILTAYPFNCHFL